MLLFPIELDSCVQQALLNASRNVNLIVMEWVNHVSFVFQHNNPKADKVLEPLSAFQHFMLAASPDVIKVRLVFIN